VLSKERLSTTGNLMLCSLQQLCCFRLPEVIFKIQRNDIISLRQGGETGIDGLLDSDKEEDFFWKATKVIDSACINAFWFLYYYLYLVP
jgi:hypothetical protein